MWQTGKPATPRPRQPRSHFGANYVSRGPQPAAPPGHRGLAIPLYSLCKLVQTVVPFPPPQVYRIHKGGSFGRRTLVSGAHDVDLSVFVIKFQERALNYEDWSGEAGERLQRDMQRAVAAYLRGQEELHDVVEVEHGTHYKHCVNVRAGCLLDER